MRSFTMMFGLLFLLAGCEGSAPAGNRSARSGRLEVAGALEFGAVALGERAERVLTLRNLGPGPLEVDSFEIPAPFGGGDGFPAVIEPGEGLDVTVAFAPAVPGPAEAVALARADGSVHEVRLAGTGGESPLRCTPDAVDLGRPVVGTVPTFRIACSNTSDREVSVHVEGPNLLRWSPESTITLPPGGSPEAFDFAYRPTSPAPFEDAVRFVAEAAVLAEVPIVARPIATAVVPDPGLACPGGLAVGFAPPGTTTTRTFAVANAGSRPLRLIAAETEGPFSVALALPVEVPADDPATPADEGRVEVPVEFAPTSMGPETGTVRLSFDDPATPVWVGCLRGLGGGPVLACSPPSLDFGPVASVVPRTELVTCHNAGTDVSGTDADRLRLAAVVHGSGFAVGDPSSQDLRPGESSTLAVTFTPTVTGPASGRLEVATPGGVQRMEIPLAGDGQLLGPCSYRVEPAALDFGPVAAGGSAATLAVAVHNLGEQRCLVRDVHLSPATSPAFALESGPVEATTIDPGTVLRIPVRYTPDGSIATGALVFAISSPSAPEVRVPLAGSTAAARDCLQIHPESVDFGEVGPGCTSLVADLIATDTCGGVLAPSDVRFEGEGDAFSVEALPPQPGRPMQVRVQYRPTGAGDHLAGLRVSNSNGESRLVPVRGRSGGPAGVETFPAVPEQLDVLFVTGSFHAQADMVVFFNAAAAGWDLDWHFGATLAHGDDGRLLPPTGTPRIVTPSTPSRGSVANTMANRGSGLQPLAAAWRALSPPLIDHADDPAHPEPNDGNLGFLRPDARLAVVVLTTDADESPESPWAYAAWLGGTKREAWRERILEGHAVVGDAETGCTRDGSGAEPGDAVIAWSRATGGTFLSACSDPWPQAWARFARGVFGRSRFALKGRPAGSPDPTTLDLQVVVDGQPWTGPANGWRWDGADNSVVFDVDWAPDPTSTVEFRYTPRCVTPTGQAQGGPPSSRRPTGPHRSRSR